MSKKFTESHEWVLISEGVGTIGISDYAQKELGEIVFIQLPEVGAHLKAHQEAVVLESTKAATDIYSPLSGEVIKINESLLKHPEIINKSAEGEGWLFKIHIAHPEEISSLMEKKDYDLMIS